jgi:hypothetical protein
MISWRVCAACIGVQVGTLNASGQQPEHKDLALFIMQHEDKTRAAHYQSMPPATCDQLLRKHKAGGPFTITLAPANKVGVPNRGLVLEVYCVKPDGVIIGADGIVTVPQTGKR